MKTTRIPLPVLLTLVLFAALSCQPPQQASRAEVLKATAHRFVALLTEKKYEEAAGLFSDELKAKLSPGQLQTTWELMIKEVGPLTRRGGEEVAKSKEGDVVYDVVVIRCHFERSQLNLRISFDAAGKIAGFFVVAAT